MNVRQKRAAMYLLLVISPSSYDCMASDVGPVHTERCGSGWCVVSGIEYCARPLPPGYFGNANIQSGGVAISGSKLQSAAGCITSQSVPTIVYCGVGQDNDGPYNCQSGLQSGCDLDSASITGATTWIDQYYATQGASLDLHDPSIKDFRVCVTFVNSQPNNTRYFYMYLET
jgi:hypothetical protein